MTLNKSLPFFSLYVNNFDLYLSSAFLYFYFFIFCTCSAEGLLISLLVNTNIYYSEVKLLSHVQLFATPWTVAHQAPQSMEFSRQEYWSGVPFPSPGDLPNPGIEPGSPALQADTLPSESRGKPYDPAIPLLGIYPENTTIQKDTCSPMFIATLFTIARTWKQPNCPLTEEWIKTSWYIYTMEYCYCSVTRSCLTLQPHELQHARFPCPLLSP